MKKLLISLLISGSMFLAGCNTPAIQKAVKASGELASTIHDGIVAAGNLYDQHVISLTQKDKIADGLVAISKAGKTFNDSVIAASKLPDKGVSQLPALAAQFDTVVTPFLNLLDELKLLSPAASATIATSIAALKTAIIIIAAALSGSGNSTASIDRLADRESESWQTALL